MLIKLKKSWQKLLLLSITASFLCLWGCGKNVFNKSDFSSASLLVRIQNAETNSDYDGIIRDATIQCQDTANRLTEEAQNQACIIQTEAFNARYGLDIYSTLIALTKLSTSTSSESDFFTSLSETVSEIPVDALKENTDILNSQADSNDEFNIANQVTRGLANTYLVVSVYRLRFDFSNDTVTNKESPQNMAGEEVSYTTDFNGRSIDENSPDAQCNGECPSYENLDFVIRELRSEENNNYTIEATNAFSFSDLTQAQQNDLNQVTPYQRLVTLRDAAVAEISVEITGSDLTVDTFNFVGHQLGSDQSEATLIRGIAHILD